METEQAREEVVSHEEVQVVCNGSVMGFPTIQKATEYVLKHWENDLYYCSFRKVNLKDNCLKFSVSRTLPNREDEGRHD